MIRARKTNLLEYFGFDGDKLKDELLERINQNIHPRTNNHVFKIGDEHDI